jgi:hypothetical protein
VRAFPDQQGYLDFARHIRENGRYPVCPEGSNSKELPYTCRERAASPDVLFKKLNDWGLDTLVIPHGTTWGFYTPLGYTWDKQLRADLDDANLQRLVEVFSGHGNSEEYRSFRSANLNEDGMECPAPTDDYEACCWRAGEVIRERCKDPDSDPCRKRVEKARADYLRVALAGHVTLPGEDVPFENPDEPRHATMGFIASSDNHTARPGTGYKEFARLQMTEARGAPSESWRASMFGSRGQAEPESISYTIDGLMERPPFELMWMERQASFFITGGLVAVHATERSREAIWDALQSRNVYGTSGDRILLWFDLENGPDGVLPMGSELELTTTPKFEVRAAGSFEQKPGCPPDVIQSLGEERVERICAGECYNPGDRRRRITRIEVIRIQRQRAADEPVADLIEDPWKTIPCPEGPELCVVEFEDPAGTYCTTSARFRSRHRPSTEAAFDAVAASASPATGTSVPRSKTIVWSTPRSAPGPRRSSCSLVRSHEPAMGARRRDARRGCPGRLLHRSHTGNPRAHHRGCRCLGQRSPRLPIVV